jgi:hypothetical protein
MNLLVHSLMNNALTGRFVPQAGRVQGQRGPKRGLTALRGLYLFANMENGSEGA